MLAASGALGACVAEVRGKRAARCRCWISIRAQVRRESAQAERDLVALRKEREGLKFKVRRMLGILRILGFRHDGMGWCEERPGWAGGNERELGVWAPQTAQLFPAGCAGTLVFCASLSLSAAGH